MNAYTNHTGWTSSSLRSARASWINRLGVVCVIVPLVLWICAPASVHALDVSIPMKWVIINGCPSEVNPALVGEATVKDVLWRRHERISEFRLIPTCGVTLRSGAFDAIPNFPIIADTQAIGNPGDISLPVIVCPPGCLPPCLDFTEFFDTIDDARDAWIALGFAGDFGITVVSMNRFVDGLGNPIGILGLGGFNPTTCNAAIQAVIGRAMVIDPAYLLPSSPINIFNDPNETILGQEILHGLTLDHSADPANLMFGFFPNGGALTAAQCDVIRAQATAHVPGTMGEGYPESQADLRSDPRGDIAESIIDVHVYGVAREIAMEQTHFFLSTAGVLSENPSARPGTIDLAFTFLMDADDDDETGGAPSDLGIPTELEGIELVGRVFLSGAAPDVSSELFKFMDGRFVPIVDENIVGSLHTDYVSVYMVEGGFVEAVGQIIQLSIPDEFVGEMSTLVRFAALSEDFENEAMDITDDVRLTFGNPVFPTCFVEPQTIVNGCTVELQAQGLPANQNAHIFLGAVLVGEAETDGDGDLETTLRLEIPGLEQIGTHLLTVGIDENAITADCVVTLVPDVDRRMDIKPGSCPNPLNRNSNGVLPVALLGEGDLVATQVVLDSLQLRRRDDVGTSLNPHEGPPGPHSVPADVATPFEGDICDCHEEASDGIVDLMMFFETQEVVAAFELDQECEGAVIELELTGFLEDGMPFCARDCIRIVPPGSLAIPGPVDFTAVVQCFADLDGDGFITIEDLTTLLGAWGTNPGHPADLDGDGNVGAYDLLAILANWGPCP